MKSKTQISCLTQHKSIVSCIDLSSDSSLVVSGSHDKTLILWDLKNNCLKNVYKGHSEEVWTVAFTQNSTHIVSGSIGKEIMLWDIDSVYFLKKIDTDGQVICGLISGYNIYYSGIGTRVIKWDLNSFTTISSIEAHDHPVSSLALSKNSQYIITGSYDKSVKIWESNSMSQYAILEGHTKEVNSVSLTADDNFIISGSSDKTIIIWEINSKQKIHQFTFHKSKIYGVIVFNDFIISASCDPSIGISEISSKSFNSFLNKNSFNIETQMIRKDLAVFGNGNNVILCDLNKRNSNIVLQSHVGKVKAVFISSKMNLVASASDGCENNLIVWDLKTKKILSSMIGHQASVLCIDISNDEKKMISGDGLGTVWLWNLSEFRQEFRFLSHSDAVFSVKITKDARFAASGGKDKIFVIWNLQDKTVHATLNGHERVIWKVLVSDDDKCFVSAEYLNTVHVWNIEEMRKEFEFRFRDQAKNWLEKNREIYSELSIYLL